MTLKAEYAALCATRDEINARIAPLKAKVAELVSAADALRVEAESVQAQIEEIRGGEKWLELKKKIAHLAKQL